MNGMNILFLTDNFPPEGNAPAIRTFEHVTRWVKAGHAVTVVTGAPNFPEGVVYPGYRNRWRQVEVLDGVRVVRVKTYIAANAGFGRRIMDYLSFMVSAIFFGLFEKRPDVVIATSPQFFCAIAGWILSGLKRRPFVFELRDLWPDSILAVGAMKRNWVIRWLERLELFLYRRADAIVSVTQSFRDRLIERGVDPEKIHVVVNGVDLQVYRPGEQDFELMREYDLESDAFVVGYLGTHGMAHGLESVLEAVALVSDRRDIRFLFAGGGARRAFVEAEVEARGLEQVTLIPRQPREQMPRLLSLCDLALVPLRDSPVFATVIPSKIFESMATGVPILMSLPEGEATGIIKQHQCGVCVPPMNPGVMASEIRALADDGPRLSVLSQRALAAASHYSRDVQAQRMMEVLLSLTGESTGRLHASSGERR